MEYIIYVSNNPSPDLLPSHVIVTNPLLSVITLPSSSRLNQPFIFVDGMTLRGWLDCLTVRRGRPSARRLARFSRYNPSRIGRRNFLTARRGSYFRALFRYTFCTSDNSAAESVRGCSGCKYMYVRFVESTPRRQERTCTLR